MFLRLSISTLFPYSFLFFFTDTAPTEIYTLSLHDALPIFGALGVGVELRLGPGHEPHLLGQAERGELFHDDGPVLLLPLVDDRFGVAAMERLLDVELQPLLEDGRHDVRLGVELPQEMADLPVQLVAA